MCAMIDFVDGTARGDLVDERRVRLARLPLLFALFSQPVLLLSDPLSPTPPDGLSEVIHYILQFSHKYSVAFLKAVVV